MQRLEVSGAVRPIYGSLGVKRLSPGKIRDFVTAPLYNPRKFWAARRLNGTYFGRRIWKHLPTILCHLEEEF